MDQKGYHLSYESNRAELQLYEHSRHHTIRSLENNAYILCRRSLFGRPKVVRYCKKLCARTIAHILNDVLKNAFHTLERGTYTKKLHLEYS